MKGICIFAHFNKNNNLENYVIDYLNAIKELVDEVIFVSTSKIDTDKKIILNKIVSKIIIRENKGYDFGSWKEGLLFIKNNYINLPNEIILCNDSCYISEKLVKKAICSMRKYQKLDFWGITMNYTVYKHIQSFFIVLNSRPLKDKKFWNKVISWGNQNLKADYIDYEIDLTQFLLKENYKMATYINISKFNILVLYFKNQLNSLISHFQKLKKKKVFIENSARFKTNQVKNKNKRSFIGSIYKFFLHSLNLTITHLDIKDLIKIKLPFLKVNKVQEILQKEDLSKLEILCTKNGFNLNHIIMHQKNISKN